MFKSQIFTCSCLCIAVFGNPLRLFGVEEPWAPHILVLGSGGLIGTALTRELKSQGYRLAEVRNREHLDLRVRGSLNIFARVNISFAFALACEVGGYRFLSQHDSSSRILENNHYIDQSVFSFLNRSKDHFPFFWIGSAMTGANMSYGKAKSNALALMQSIPHGKVVHPWNVYGSVLVSVKNHVIEDWINQCLWYRKVVSLTNGHEFRNFMYATDAALSLIAFMKNFERLSKETDLCDIKTPWTSLREVAGHIQRILPNCNFSWSPHNPHYSFPKRTLKQSVESSLISSSFTLETGIDDLVRRIQRKNAEIESWTRPFFSIVFLTLQPETHIHHACHFLPHIWLEVFVLTDSRSTVQSLLCSMSLEMGLEKALLAQGEFVIVVGTLEISETVWGHFQRYDRLRRGVVYVVVSPLPFVKHYPRGTKLNLPPLVMVITHRSYWSMLLSLNNTTVELDTLVRDILCYTQLDLVLLDLFTAKSQQQNFTFDPIACSPQPISLNQAWKTEATLLLPNPKKKALFARQLPIYNYEVPSISDLPLPLLPTKKGRYGQIDLLIRSYVGAHALMLTCMHSVILFWPKHLGRIILVLDSEDPMSQEFAALWPNVDVVLEDMPLNFQNWSMQWKGYARQSWSSFYADRVTAAKHIALMDTDVALITYGIEELMFKEGKVRAVGWHSNHGYRYDPLSIKLPYSGFGGMSNLPALVKREVFGAVRTWALEHVNKTMAEVFKDNMYSQYNFLQDMAWQSFRDHYDFESNCNHPGIHVGAHFGWAESKACSICPVGPKTDVSRTLWVSELEMHSVCIALYVLISDAKTRGTVWAGCQLSSVCEGLAHKKLSQMFDFQWDSHFSTCSLDELVPIANDLIIGIINTAVLTSCNTIEHVVYQGLKREGNWTFAWASK
eukprot:gb/GEZN01001561.1/.p1 GENE.gb/GEZN01001561.1/~~gb/GEZN01001561.1/.p1  ORF type:complete len:899 (-),score=26.88 gb/GEZN01001561.1/:229-2925(-)